MRSYPFSPSAEWLEADGLGGFASGTVSGIRSRRYHALLLAASTPPTGRLVLVNGFDAEVETPEGSFAISTQRYTPGVEHPDGAKRIESFTGDPWPRWTFLLEDGVRIEQEIFVPRDLPVVVLGWRLLTPRERVSLTVRPFLSGRDYHSLHRENGAFRFEAGVDARRVLWQPYLDLPEVAAFSNGEYLHRPLWHRGFLYLEEQARGLDCVEDLASPGVFRFDLSQRPATWILSAGREGPAAASRLEGSREVERARRRKFPSRLHRAADAYVVRRGNGKTILAGYPWFTDWGRDTFISLRGISIAGGRLDEAREVLLQWSGAVSEGMLPNRFPDRGEAPEYNSVDASLWFVVAVGDYLKAVESKGDGLPPADRRALGETVQAILAGYAAGTRYGIRLDHDGLLAAGEPGLALTWMDARVNERAVTPRIGKPVEVQALWLNALAIGNRMQESPASGPAGGWAGVLERGLGSFRERFWNESGGCLHDVVDPDHRPGTADPSFRPNQVFAAGGLPLLLLEGDRARRVVDAVEARLWTPLGLRSLAPGEGGYTPRYQGGVPERDGAYHQGIAWPWLLGPFVEAWVRARGGAAAVKREARLLFLEPLLRHLDEAGLGHISEIADGEPPYTPRGCPFQAWSVGEALRLAEGVLKDP